MKPTVKDVIRATSIDLTEPLAKLQAEQVRDLKAQILGSTKGERPERQRTIQHARPN